MGYLSAEGIPDLEIVGDLSSHIAFACHLELYQQGRHGGNSTSLYARIERANVRVRKTSILTSPYMPPTASAFVRAYDVVLIRVDSQPYDLLSSGVITKLLI